MLSIWTHHIKDPEQKAKYEQELKYSVSSFNTRLKEILRDMDVSLDKQEISVKAYDNPNWQFRQADTNGFRRCLKKLFTILDLDQKEQDERPDSSTGHTSVRV